MDLTRKRLERGEARVPQTHSLDCEDLMLFDKVRCRFNTNQPQMILLFWREWTHIEVSKNGVTIGIESKVLGINGLNRIVERRAAGHT